MTTFDGLFTHIHALQERFGLEEICMHMSISNSSRFRRPIVSAHQTLESLVTRVYLFTQRGLALRPIRLRSRRGEGGMIWTILTISLVATVAAAVLFVIGPKILDLGQQATTKIQSPPW